MTATGHAIIGTVLAVQFANPLIGIPLAVFSHLAADAFPHWDTGTNQKKKSHATFWIHSLIDLFISYAVPFFLIIFLAPETNLIYLYSMVFAAQLFDWVTVPYAFFKWKTFPYNLAYKLQKPFDNRLDKPWGIIWQALVLVLLVVWAKLY